LANGQQDKNGLENLFMHPSKDKDLGCKLQRWNH